MRYIILTLVAVSSSQSLALKPSAFYVIYDDIISPGLLATHIQALKDFKAESSKAGYQDPYYFDGFDNGHYMAFNPQVIAVTETAHDKAWQAIESKISKLFLQENAKAYHRSTLDQEIMKLLYLPAVSFDEEVDDYSKHITWLQMHVMGGQRGALQSALGEWVKQLKAQNSELRFSVYRKSFGAHLSQFIMIFHQAVHTAPNQLLPQAVLEKISAYDVSHGIYQPEAFCGFRSDADKFDSLNNS